MRGTENIHLDNVASENCSIIFKKKKKIVCQAKFGKPKDMIKNERKNIALRQH